MRYQQVIILVSMTVLGLAGCGSSDSGSSSLPSSELDSAEKIFLADPDDESVEISDAAVLGDDIDNIFGDESAESIEIDPSETIGDVLDRAKNS